MTIDEMSDAEFQKWLGLTIAKMHLAKADYLNRLAGAKP